jgi:hypothetical protein
MFKGAAKGAASTFVATPIQAGAKIAASAEGLMAKRDDSGIAIGKQTDDLIAEMQKLQPTDPKRTELERQVRDNINKLTAQGSNSRGAESAAAGQQTLDIGNSKEKLGEALGNKTMFTPTNAAQKIGYGIEQTAEYAIPSAKVAKTEKLLDLAVKESEWVNLPLLPLVLLVKQH